MQAGKLHEKGVHEINVCRRLTSDIDCDFLVTEHAENPFLLTLMRTVSNKVLKFQKKKAQIFHQNLYTSDLVFPRSIFNFQITHRDFSVHPVFNYTAKKIKRAKMNVSAL